jgi:uncharacterized protein (TIGR03086 family)
MIDLRPACSGMVDVLAGITDDQLADPTPCANYTVGDIVDHVDQVSRGATALALLDADGVRDAGSSPIVVHLEPRWQDRVADHIRTVGEVWGDPAVWRRAEGVPGSGLSSEVWGKITLTEFVVHAWDIARATGQSFALPEPTLIACLDHVETFVPNAPVPGLWGPPREVGSDASLLDRIVAVTGRIP